MKEINIWAGRIRGEETAYPGVTVFRGIPYAAPPVGALRWQPPQPVPHWKRIRMCRQWPPMAYQPPQDAAPESFRANEFYDNPFYLSEPSEDCLYLNVWTSAMRQGAGMPVAVWFHGGGFQGGTSFEKPFDGEQFAKLGVVLVTVGYRCNVFGFFSCRELTMEQGSSGNYGLLDQLAALRWVHDNIAAFGGDPHCVTIFGQGAGAVSVQTLVNSPLTAGLAHRAIMQSGGGYRNGMLPARTQATAEEQGELLYEAAGVSTLKELRDLPAPVLYEAGQRATAQWQARYGDAPVYAPVQDGKLLPAGYDECLRRGMTMDIDYMLGCTANDLTLPGGAPDALYQGCLDWCRMQDALGRKKGFAYQFVRQMPGDDAGAYHGSELWYMFGSAYRCWRPLSQADLELSTVMVRYWTNVIKTGNPNGPGLPEWPECDGTSETVQTLDVGLARVAVKHSSSKRRREYVINPKR